MENQNQTNQKTQDKSKKKVEIVLSGDVVSARADKTITVSVQRIFQHPVYKKIVRKKKKYLAHDEHNRCKVGDTVRIKLVRPISKRKRWLLVDVLSTTSASSAPGKDKKETPDQKENENRLEVPQ